MRTHTQYAVYVGSFLLGIFCVRNLRRRTVQCIYMNHGDTSLLGLDEDWDSKVGPQTVGAKIRHGEYRVETKADSFD
jgi:hypothetical protein